MLKPGEKVLYPLHGAGTVDKIETKDNGFGLRPFYIVNLINSGMIVSVPVLTARQSGLRNVLPKEEMEKAMDGFSVIEAEDEPNWNKRCRKNLELLRLGDVRKTAAVYKDLRRRNAVKMLSSGERKIYQSAKHMLVTEIMLSLDLKKDEAEKRLEEAIG